MRAVQKITVINKGGYVFNYSVQWLGSDGRWVTSTWNSGNYPVAQSVTTPPLETIGVPADALAVTVYGHAVLGSSGQGTPFVAYAANDALLNFNVASDREKAKKYLTISQEQLRRLSGLVEQILSMSMERRKTMKLSTEDVNIRSVVTPLISQQKLKADKPTDITTDIPEELSIKTDRMHFANIISNLIDNAIKYSCDKADISIAACTENHQVVIRVTDRGIGIAADKQKYIFDKFYRVPHGNQHEAKGYGLGLYYVKSMMDKLHGSITVKSEPGKGTTFILKFND